MNSYTRPAQDPTVRTYEIVADFFDSDKKVQKFREIVKNNGVDPNGIQTATGDPVMFTFEATRSKAFGVFFDLEAEGIIGDDLLAEFDSAFEKKEAA